MFTRCPACATRFRTHPEQLQIAAGRVRCGRCGHLFIVAPEPPLITPPNIVWLPATDPQVINPPSTSSKRWGQLIALLLGFFSLVLPGAWWERERIILAYPEIIPLLEPLCPYLPCNWEAWRAPQQIKVLERGLDPDPQHPERLYFHAKLANQSSHPQPYPQLELSLLDHQEKIIERRQFRPAEYLPTPPPPYALWRTDAALEVRLDLPDIQAQVSGFQVDFH